MRCFPRALGVSLAILMALSGCTTSRGLHPQLQPSSSQQVAATMSLAASHLSPADWPAGDWWQALGDPQLNQLEQEALAHNPDLALADARLRSAQAQVLQRRADRLPNLGLNAGISGGRMPPALLPAAGHFKSGKYGALNVQWDLDLWGGKRQSWEAAVGQAQAAEVDRQAARVTLSTAVAEAYIQFGYAFAQREVAQAEQQRSQLAARLTRQRVAAGIDNQSQVKQSDAEVASAEQQRLAAEQAISDARIALAVLLGQGPDRGLSLQPPQALPQTLPGLPSSIPAELLGHRADLVAARWRVESAEHSIRASKTQFLPNISITAMLGALAVGSANPFEFPAAFYGGGPALSLPIFDGDRRRAQLRDADASYDQAVAQYNKILVQALNDVAQQQADVQSIQAQLNAQQQARDAAAAAWALSEQRYHAGVGNYLEALIIRQQLLQADQRLAELHARQWTSTVQLIQALGGGFHAPVPTLADSTSHSSL